MKHFQFLFKYLLKLSCAQTLIINHLILYMSLPATSSLYMY